MSVKFIEQNVFFFETVVCRGHEKGNREHIRAHRAYYSEAKQFNGNAAIEI